MPHYTPPINDMMFIIHQFLNIDDYKSISKINDLSDNGLAESVLTDNGLAESVLTESGRIARDILLPLNMLGDMQGCKIEHGTVKTPDGFRDAYAQTTAGGWSGLACDAAFGGMDMSLVLSSMVSEMFSSCNMAFAMYAGLTHGAYSAIHAHGTDAQKQLYLPKLSSGLWTGTMNLTEPHCGTDLGLLRTKAVPQPDGTYHITGQKIFISAGDHDLTDNIIHLVLARTPNSPDGIKGISLFIVPKILCDDAGNLQQKNTVSCGKLEEKMGIHGNSTCVMNYDSATGYLLGNVNEGLKSMFVMMNEARLGVAIQGVSQSEIAYQNAVSYAKDRQQGRSLGGIKNPNQSADAIIHHPDIRRMLLNLRSFNESARALIADVSVHIDISHHHDDEKIKRNSDDYVSLMTPILKGYFTDKAFELCVQAQQIFGGHGYIKEWGMEQYVRDSRIAMIYEGTNNIQALDFVMRKLPRDNGRAIMSYIQKINMMLGFAQDNPDLNDFFVALDKCKNALQTTCLMLMKNGQTDPEQTASIAYPIMQLMGITSLCYVWTKTAMIADNKLKNPDDKNAPEFYQTKLMTGRYFIHHHVPEIDVLLQRIMLNKQWIMQIPTDLF